MADPLHVRYMTAFRAYRQHTKPCSDCGDTALCPEGQRLYDVFSRAQDAYLARQSKQR